MDNRHNEPTVLVFFDLETSGLRPNCDILQMAMTAGNSVLYEYVCPTQPIDPGATAVHGLTTDQSGRLYRYGQAVSASPLDQVLQRMLQFLENLPKPATLIAHNGFRFDARLIVRAIKVCQLESAFQNVVADFADSYVLFGNLFPNKKRSRSGQLKLATLAQELLHLNVQNAHDALGDAELLRELLSQYFDYDTVVQSARSFASFL